MVKLIICIYLIIGFCLSVYGITGWMEAGKHRDETRLSILIPALSIFAISVTLLWPIVVVVAALDSILCR